MGGVVAFFGMCGAWPAWPVRTLLVALDAAEGSVGVEHPGGSSTQHRCSGLIVRRQKSVRSLYCRSGRDEVRSFPTRFVDAGTITSCT